MLVRPVSRAMTTGNVVHLEAVIASQRVARMGNLSMSSPPSAQMRTGAGTHNY
jgi:hypothetical protein